MRQRDEIQATVGSVDWEQKKLNCWEFKRCGREPGGRNTALFGICPAPVMQQADGLHGGANGGRCCWFVTVSCDKKGQQECSAKKAASCLSCDFYNMVRREEHSRFILRHIRPRQTRQTAPPGCPALPVS